MKTQAIEIIDRGRGPQLSTSRITVQDLVHYFQRGAGHDEIIHWMPTLSHDEIAAVERYYLDHKVELDDKECHLQKQRDEQIRLQRLRFPPFEGTKEEHLARLKGLLEKRRQGKNGEGHPGRQ
jgi:uncharacterized protein (DUF433 family)